jgi:hypothetical protein
MESILRFLDNLRYLDNEPSGPFFGSFSGPYTEEEKQKITEYLTGKGDKWDILRLRDKKPCLSSRKLERFIINESEVLDIGKEISQNRELMPRLGRFLIFFGKIANGHDYFRFLSNVAESGLTIEEIYVDGGLGVDEMLNYLLDKISNFNEIPYKLLGAQSYPEFFDNLYKKYHDIFMDIIHKGDDPENEDPAVSLFCGIYVYTHADKIDPKFTEYIIKRCASLIYIAKGVNIDPVTAVWISVMHKGKIANEENVELSADDAFKAVSAEPYFENNPYIAELQKWSKEVKIKFWMSREVYKQFLHRIFYFCYTLSPSPSPLLDLTNYIIMYHAHKTAFDGLLQSSVLFFGKRVDELFTQSLPLFKPGLYPKDSYLAYCGLRLELALSSNRTWAKEEWTKEEWTKLFVENPIMHIFAIGLIWGTYDANGKLLNSFRYMEDGTFTNVSEDEVELPADAAVGLCHPLDMGDELIARWMQQLSDYEFKQPVDQLSRKVFRLDEDKKDSDSVTEFGGAVIYAVSLIDKLQKLGWHKGLIQDPANIPNASDSYSYNNFYKEDRKQGIGVWLNFSGTHLGVEEDEEVTVYDAVFYKAGKVGYGSYYAEVKPGDRLKLADIPARLYSELCYDIERATANRIRTDADWEKQDD